MEHKQAVKIIECPRDAMQGLHTFISTEDKVKYINQLLRTGFDTIDCGSFVSPKAVPQMADTARVISELFLTSSTAKLLTIIANARGAEEASHFPQIAYLGFPLSLSETFQQRNTNRSIGEAFRTIAEIQEIGARAGQEAVIYLSMGFGNPYGDKYSPEIALDFVSKLDTMGIRIVSLADTVGTGEPEVINLLFSTLIPAYPHIEFGAHLHSKPDALFEKLEAAWQAGCRRFDAAMKGFGGCPMAKDELVGNVATESLMAFIRKKGLSSGISETEFEKSLSLATEIFQA